MGQLEFSFGKLGKLVTEQARDVVDDYWENINNNIISDMKYEDSIKDYKDKFKREIEFIKGVMCDSILLSTLAITSGAIKDRKTLESLSDYIKAKAEEGINEKTKIIFESLDEIKKEIDKSGCKTMEEFINKKKRENNG